MSTRTPSLRQRGRAASASRATLLLFSLCATTLASGLAFADKPGPLSPQTLKMPNGPASLKGLGESFSPNIALGGGSYSVPLELPPGFLAPKLALTYSSGRGKGVLGLGWALPVLQIYRTTDKGMPRYTQADRFAVSGGDFNDELVLVDAVALRYRLKNEGSFALFTYDKGHDAWTIALPSGDKIELGTDIQSRQATSRGTYRWWVRRHSDPFCHTRGSQCLAHATEYDYSTRQGHTYLDAIRYQTHAPDELKNRVELEYGPRNDVFTDYTYGQADTTAERLTEIRVKQGQGTDILRKYQLSYTDYQLFSVLSTVKLIGKNECDDMPALLFGYLPQSAAGVLVDMVSNPPLEGLLSGEARLEDVTGDALPDLLIGSPGNYRYYENIDGRRWGASPIAIALPPDRSLADADVVLADADGDGFRDVVHAQGDHFRYYPGGAIQTGRFIRYGAPVELAIGAPLGDHWGSSSVRLTDLNKDGRTDLLMQVPGGVRQVINGKDNRLRVSETAPLPADVQFTDRELALVDFNGDGHLDFVWKRIGFDEGRMRVWFGLGDGRYTSEREMSNVPKGAPEEFYLEDVNRDGQTDIIRHSGGSIRYYLNTGRQSFTEALGVFNNAPYQSQILKTLFADMNGNGTSDIVWVMRDYKLRYYDLLAEPNFGLLERIDNGLGAVTTIHYQSSTEFMVNDKARGEAWKTPMTSSMPVVASLQVSDSFATIGPDFHSQVSETIYEYRDGYYDGKEREFRGFAQVIATELGDNTHPSLMTETHLHVGRNLDTGEDEEALKGKPYQQFTFDESGNLYSSVETVWHLRWLWQEDLPGEALLVLPRRGDGVSDAGLAARKDDLVAFGEELEVLTGTWEGGESPRYSYATKSYDAFGNVIESTNYGEVTLPLARRVGDPWDADLDITKVQEDEAVLTVATFHNDTGTWLVRLPKTSETGSLLGSPRAKELFLYDVGIDEEEQRPITKGKMTRHRAWLAYGESSADDHWVDVERNEYNRDGQLVRTLDAEDNVRQLGYDVDTGAFLVSESIEAETLLDQVGPGGRRPSSSQWFTYSAQYDTGTGQVLSASDFAGVTTRFTYDNLGRLTSIIDQQSTDTAQTSTFAYTYGSTDEYPVSTTVVGRLVDRGVNPARYHTTVIFSDGLGRERLKKTEAEEPFQAIATGWQEYSKRGKPTAVFESFVALAQGIERAPSETRVTRTRYDVLGREVAVFPPSPPNTQTSTRTVYLPWEVRVFDELDTATNEWGYPATSKLDGLGRLVDIVKKNNPSPGNTIPAELQWHVGYDALGNITSITDPGQHPRYYLYDTLRRLRHIDDPNAGSIDLTYDDAGKLISRQDALNQLVVNEYGKGGRLLARHVSGSPFALPDVSYYFFYDHPTRLFSGAQGLSSRLSGISSPIGDAAWSYDDLGRVVIGLQSLRNPDLPEQAPEVFRSELTYDPQGKIITEFLPEMSLTHSYNARQLPAGLTAVRQGGGSHHIGEAYDVRGLALRSDYGNGLSTCRWYDERGRLSADHTRPTAGLGPISTDEEYAGCGERSTTPGQPIEHSLVHRLYEYTPNGLIAQVLDLSPERTELPRLGGTYGYDRLYQLVHAETQVGTLDYAYDAIQNLTHVTSSNASNGQPAGDLSYLGSGPNQVTSAFGATYQYDAAGQLKYYNGYTLLFDVEGRLVEASKPGGTRLRWFYDFAGERRLKISEVPGEPTRVYKYPLDGYQERDGDFIWLLRSGNGVAAEVALQRAPIPDLALLDNLIIYGNGSGGETPLPWQYDAISLEQALESYWDQQSAPGRTEAVKYFHPDHIGGPSHVTDSQGNLVAYTNWHPYGLESATRGLAPHWTFAGAEREPERELGLMQFGARWYAPKLGRWVSPDPLYLNDPSVILKKPLEGGNLYGYVSNNPINTSDPSGLGGPMGWSPGEVKFRQDYPEQAAANDRQTAAVGVVSLASLAAPVATGWAIMLGTVATWKNDKEADVGPIALMMGSAGVGKLIKAFGKVLAGEETAAATLSGERTAEAAGISPGDATRIQNAANRTKQQITVVGSRANGTAKPTSDWDYVMSGSSRQRHSAKSSVPRGSAGGEQNASGRETGIDVMTGSVDTSKPHVAFKPQGSE